MVDKQGSGVAYEMAIIGAQLSEDEPTSFEQSERLDQIVRLHGGEPVEAWEYHFSTFADAKEAEREIRQMGLGLSDIRIRTVYGVIGGRPLRLVDPKGEAESD